jgi:hypothetical protein
MSRLEEIAISVAKRTYLPDGKPLLSGLVGENVIKYFASEFNKELEKEPTSSVAISLLQRPL